MPDNLTIQISADSGKARADIELLKAQLRAAQKEARDFAKAGAEACDKFPSKQLTDASNRVGALAAQLKSLNRTTKETSNVMDVLATKSMRRLLTQFDNVGKSVQNIAMVMGGVTGSFAGGFLAASVIKSASTLVELLGQAEERLKGIRDTARGMGTKPLNLQAAQEAALASGQTAEVGTAIAGGIADLMAKAETATKEQTNFDGIKVMRGSVAAAGDAAQTAAGHFQNLSGVVDNTVRVFRGGVPVMQDFSDPLKVIGVDASSILKGRAGDADRFTKAVLEGFKRIAEGGRLTAIQLNELSKSLFRNTPAETTLKTLDAQLADVEKRIAELSQSARGATPEAIVSQEAVDASKERVNRIFRELLSSDAQWRRQVAADWNNWLADFLGTTLPGFAQSVVKIFGDMWTEAWANLQKNGQQAYTDFTAAWEPVGQFFTNLGDQVIAAWDRVFNWIKEQAAAVKQAVSSTLSGFFPGDPGGAPAMPAGNAAGGMIRGPGSGTSDSILARLSNGEFVMRARAVEHWGPRFMAALNNIQNPFGYAGGGLVPRFAAGGLVGAGAGDGRLAAAFHFESGAQFRLTGPADVVNAMVREANGQRMRSAGVKPSWYGGH